MMGYRRARYECLRNAGTRYYNCIAPRTDSTALMPHQKSVHIPVKLYALLRMRIAIDRAIACSTRNEKEKAARWAAVWGEAAGIPKIVNSAMGMIVPCERNMPGKAKRMANAVPMISPVDKNQEQRQ